MKALYFKLREALLINRLSHFIPGMVKPFILCYHQIDTAEFDAQLAALKKRFEIVDLKTFTQRIKQKQGGAYCTLTLDDCVEEDMEKAAAVCRKHNLPITLFLPVGYSVRHEALPGTWLQKLLEKKKEVVINGEKLTITPENFLQVKHKANTTFHPAKLRISEYDKAMRNLYAENNITENDIITDDYRIITVDTVKKLAAEEIFNFQSHTYNHESLGLCTPAEIEKEFADSKKALEEITGKEIFAICYPYGSKEVIGDKIFSFVGNYYTCGFSLVQGVCTKKTDMFFMPRIGIYPGDGLNAFWGKIYHHMQTAFIK